MSTSGFMQVILTLQLDHEIKCRRLASMVFNSGLGATEAHSDQIRSGCEKYNRILPGLLPLCYNVKSCTNIRPP